MTSPHTARPSQIMVFPQPSHRLSAASGVVAVLLLIGSILAFGLNPPTYDDAPRAFAAYYAVHDSSIELSALLGIFGGAAFVWFAAFLRWSYGNAELAARGFQRATPIAFGGAIAGVTVSLVSDIANQAAVVAEGTVEPGVIRALSLMGAYSLNTAAVLLSIFLLASFFMIRVTNVLPAWLGYVAMVGTALGVV